MHSVIELAHSKNENVNKIGLVRAVVKLILLPPVRVQETFNYKRGSFEAGGSETLLDQAASRLELLLFGGSTQVWLLYFAL